MIRQVPPATNVEKQLEYLELSDPGNRTNSHIGVLHFRVDQSDGESDCLMVDCWDNRFLVLLLPLRGQGVSLNQEGLPGLGTQCGEVTEELPTVAGSSVGQETCPPGVGIQTCAILQGMSVVAVLEGSGFMFLVSRHHCCSAFSQFVPMLHGIP